MNRLASAWREVERVNTGGLAPPAPLSAPALAGALGVEVDSCRLWRSNRNSRLYEVCARGASPMLAKQSLSLPSDAVATEYAHLQRLDALEGVAFRVPRPGPLLLPHRAYLMERAPGAPLAAGPGPDGVDAFVDACAGAGRALADLHRAWSAGTRPVDTGDIMDDLARIPGGLADRETRALTRRLLAAAGAQAAVGQPHMDFDPVNVFRAPDGAIWLIDPPDEAAEELLAWDAAVFRVGLRRMLWRRPGAAGPGARAAIARASAAFSDAYAGAAGLAPGARRAWDALVDVLEFARVAQLMIWRHKRASRLDKTLRSVIARLVTRPLLARERRRVIGAMERAA